MTTMVLYARDIVEKDFLSLSADTPILEGAKAMKNSKHGFAIIGTPAQPEGIVTEWDVVAKVVAEGRDPATAKMGDIMSTELLSVGASTGLSSVSQIMTERGVRRLLVKDGNQVIGFITSKTMLARMNEYVDKVSSQISRLQTPLF
jgi:signal-transduction protein with cAMP-binding, CBS, and nucleotidyltransferase domain